MASKESTLRSTFYMDVDLKKLARKMAKDESRTLSNFIAWLVRSYAQEHGYLKGGK